MANARIVRIGNAGGYWGDDPWALRRQVRGEPPLDVITIDYLAEVTMSILRKQMAKDPALGYATDFVAQAAPLLEEILARRIRIVTNAGGMNPAACAEALAREARARGLSLRIAVVEGDDLAPRIPELLEGGEAMRHMETREPLAQVAGRVLAANAYFGAMPVARALERDPHVVICGRVTDTGITLGPLMHAFGWGPGDYDRLASGIVAGHLIECGAQATGGNFTDWRKVPTFVDMGFPFVEVRPDGVFHLTKHPGSGGLVTAATVREQLLYEMGHPRSYLTPDVTADFSTADLVQDGPDRVRVEGVTGRPPTEFLKVSLAYADGFKCQGALIVSGPDARAKSEVFARTFFERLERELGHAPEATLAEHVGDDATHAGLTPPHRAQEILLRLSARSRDRHDLEVFRKLLPSLILSGPCGVAVTGGAPTISEVVGYWPALVHRDQVLPRVRILEEREGALAPTWDSGPLPWPATSGEGVHPFDASDPWTLAAGAGPRVKVPLLRIAHARSGDKGDTANIGLIGRSGPCYAWLRDNIDAARVKAWFGELCLGGVERHAVPRLWALNFLLERALGGGGTLSLRIDAQGKTLAQALLRCQVEIPETLLATISPEDRACPGETLPEGAPS